MVMVNSRLCSVVAGIVATGLCVVTTPAHAFEGGDIIVTYGNQIRVFDKTRVYKQTIDLSAVAPDPSAGNCILPSGHLLVMGYTNTEAGGTGMILEIDGAGNLMPNYWGDNPTMYKPESCVVDAINGWVYIGEGYRVGDRPRNPSIHRFSIGGQWQATWTPTRFDASGTDNLALGGPNNCVVSYTSEGNFVHQYDVCANGGAGDQLNSINISHVGRTPVLLPDGGMLVASSNQVLHFDGPPGYNVRPSYTPVDSLGAEDKS